MSYDFKKINELELVNAVPEGANVLIETEGATKRLPSTAIKGSIDVIAKVGQTIIVKSVDENGKPTEWEMADYQPRTHWSDETIVLPETQMVYYEDSELFGTEFAHTFVEGDTYIVNWNGTEYTCVAFTVDTDGDGVNESIAVGNPLPFGGENNDAPFALLTNEGMLAALPIDGSSEVMVSIRLEKITKIPEKYLDEDWARNANATDIQSLVSRCDTLADNVNSLQRDTSKFYHMIKLAENFTPDGSYYNYGRIAYDMISDYKYLNLEIHTYEGERYAYIQVPILDCQGNTVCARGIYVIDPQAQENNALSITAYVKQKSTAANIFWCKIDTITI